MKLKRLKTEQNGFVLIVVLCMVILLGILLFGFNHKSRAELLVVDDLQNSEQALNCARAGLNIAIAAIRETADFYKNRKLWNLLSGKNTFPIGDGNCSITVAEENGKLNINLLKDENGKLNKTIIDQLLRLIDILNQEQHDDFIISYSLIPSIIDWIDDDSEITHLPFIKHENTGAESGYYNKLTAPYRCKNSPLEMTEELLLVKGITPEVFSRLRDYVTVRGDGKININFASKHVIRSLSKDIDPVLAQMIINRRQINPFGNVSELQDVPGMTDSVYQRVANSISVSSKKQYYQVTSQGNFNSHSCTIVATLGRNTTTKNIDLIAYKEL
jgi:general secretion pathway protein K